MLLAKQLIRNKKAVLIVTYMHQVKDCFIESRNQHDFFDTSYSQDFILRCDHKSINAFLRKYCTRKMKIIILIVNALDK